jgi:hypothetical protein
LSGLPRFLEKLLGLLDRSKIPHMVTGSLASVYHGEPRASRDVDIVIAPTLEQLDSFVELARPDFYVSRDEAIEALEKRSLFNVVDLETGWKADLVVRKDRSFSLVEFDRRRRVDLHATSLYVVSPEDSILTKLEWAKDSGSEIQRRDALGIAVAQREGLDYDYLRHWAGVLGIGAALEALIRDAASS